VLPSGLNALVHVLIRKLPQRVERCYLDLGVFWLSSWSSVAIVPNRSSLSYLKSSPRTLPRPAVRVWGRKPPHQSCLKLFFRTSPWLSSTQNLCLLSPRSRPMVTFALRNLRVVFSISIELITPLQSGRGCPLPSHLIWMTARTIGRKNSPSSAIIALISLAVLLLSFRVMVRYSVG
jgi:hypothetical protein